MITEEFQKAPETYEILPFENPIEFAMFFHPALSQGFHKLYQWQVWAQLLICAKRWTKDKKLEFYLVANNGSGKDSYIIAICALFLICCTRRHRVVVTTNDTRQMIGQTYPHIKTLAEYINKGFKRLMPSLKGDFINYKYGYVSCPYTGGDIVMFVTDEAGRAEGYHPATDHAEADLTIIVNEGKSIKKPIYQALYRCTGHSRYIVVSSAGFDSGYFYEQVQKARAYPNPIEPGKTYTRTITAFDCPSHFSTEEIERAQLDLEPWLFDSIYLSKFSSVTGQFVINRSMFLNEHKLTSNVNDSYCGGLDLSLGGDETVCVIRKGPVVYWEGRWRITDAPKLEATIANELKALGLPDTTQMFVDAGGLGKPIYQHLVKMVPLKWFPITNQSRPWSKLFKNVGAEDYFHYRNLLIKKLIEVPTDELTRDQLVARRYEQRDGAIKLESKEDARARGEKSPDRADARVLAFRRYRFNELNKITSAKSPVIESNIINLRSPAGREALIELMESFNAQRTKPKDRSMHGIVNFLSSN